MITLFCPFCDEEHTLEENQVSVMCSCQRQLWLEADGEFVDGHWRDRSKFICYEEGK